MSKKIIATVLAICILLSVSLPVFAEEAEATPNYYRLSAEIHDNNCVFDSPMDFMILGNENGVYVNAENFNDVLNANGYSFGLSYQNCAFVNSETKRAVMFEFGSDIVDVQYYCFDGIKYTAPMPALLKNGVAWIPFSFAVEIFDCHSYIDNNKLIVTSPDKTALDVASKVYYNKDDYSFNWVNEIGYTEKDTYAMSSSAKTVNLLNSVVTGGIKEFGMLIKYVLFSDTSEYDAQFEQEIAQLFIKPCQSETQAAIDEACQSKKDFYDFVKGGISNTNTITELIDNGIKSGDLLNVMEKLVEAYPMLAKDKKFSNFMTALKDKKGWAKDINDQLYKATDMYSAGKWGVKINALDLIEYAVDISGYFYIFANKNDYAVSALEQYAKNTDGNESKVFLSYTKTANGENGVLDVLNQYLKDNAGKIVSNSVSVDAVLGAPAVIVRVGWDVLSNTFPFIKGTLDSMKSHELADYAMMYQNSSSEMMLEKRAACVKGFGSFNENKLDSLMKSTYAYLKFSMIARNAGQASVKAGHMDAAIKEREIKRMEDKNAQVAKCLNILEVKDIKDAGYLPSENKKFLSNWNDSELLEFLRTKAEKIDASYQETIPTSELCLSPYSYKTLITKEEAVELVKKTLGKYLTKMFDYMLDQYYIFEAEDELYSSGEDGMQAYIVNMAVQVSDEEPQYDNGTRFFVSVYGDHIWMGEVNSDGSYTCYTQVDIIDLSWASLAKTLGDLFEDIDVSDFYN